MNMPPLGTTAHMPDLNWSQVRETVLLLELAAGQIEAAMRDSNSSVEVLTQSFTTMANFMRTITETVQQLPESTDLQGTREQLLGASGQVEGMMHQAIIAFQFYDKLVQRLSHVGHSLGSMSDLVADQSRLFNPAEWVNLQNEIRAKYSTKDEVTMFESVMQGMPVHHALENYVASLKDKGDDIELF